MALIDKEIIRKEIERRTYNAHEMPDSRPDKQFYEGKDVAYGEILSILDSLPEQPVEGLEEEIDACWQNWLSPSNQKEVEGVLPKTEFATYASHFAEWGKNNMK